MLTGWALTRFQRSKNIKQKETRGRPLKQWKDDDDY
jgi:hypothetical protein